MRILIVDDEEEIVRVLKAGFESEYFTVDAATDGERGLYLARINEYDVIVLDGVLPKKSGEEVCRELRADGKTVPILMLSIQSEVPRRIDMLNFGADDYVGKPFSLAEVVARVRALMRRPHRMEHELLRADDLTMDTRAYAVERAGRQLKLTKKEFELLEYMLRNKGKVLSRGMIIEHVWDMSADPFSNTIETHILNLRRKIDGGHEKKLICTVSGRGYKVEER